MKIGTVPLKAGQLESTGSLYNIYLNLVTVIVGRTHPGSILIPIWDNFIPSHKIIMLTVQTSTRGKERTRSSIITMRLPTYSLC